MAARTLKPYFIVLGLLAVTSIALAFTVDVNLVDVAGVKSRLPDQLGRWKGDEIRFCLNKSCQGQFFCSELTNRDVCPKCGGKLFGLSKVEMDLLPSDTEGMKERYQNSDGRQVVSSIVLSGRERASIHRPEVCLRGQGNVIRNSEVIDVPIAGREPLRVKVLELVVDRENQNGTHSSYYSYYAYWFAGKGRDTPEHWQRMLWMATDRIFHNVAHRWAYIAVAGLRAEGKKDYQNEIRDVIGQLYPQITIK
jgi:hypothetical protein